METEKKILEQSSAAIGRPWTEELHAALVHHVAEIERAVLGVVALREGRRGYTNHTGGRIICRVCTALILPAKTHVCPGCRPLGYQAFMVAGRRADGRTPKLSKAVMIVADLEAARFWADYTGPEYAVYELSVETLDEVPMEGADRKGAANATR